MPAMGLQRETLMPIIRTYACPECNLMTEVTLTLEQWEDPPPDCPACAQQGMVQEFRPPAIVGSARARATAVAEDIAANDYHVADMQTDHREGSRPKVRLKDKVPNPSDWGKAGDGSVITRQALEHAMALGRQTRLRYGDGLEVLQSNIKSGAEPDLIAESKKRSARIW
jgi:hypothetical protein